MKKNGIIIATCIAIISVVLIGVTLGKSNANATNNTDKQTTPTEPQTTSVIVAQITNEYTLSLEIPEGWEYEKTEYPYSTHSPRYCISFWPEGQSEGRISLQYRNGLFGVCGTGLESEDITIGKYKASKGTYDNNDVWSFIIIDNGGDGTDSYVILNEGADLWWDKYGDEAMKILQTVLVGVDNYELCSEPLAEGSTKQ